MFGLLIHPERTKGVLNVFETIDNLMVQPGMTKDVLVLELQKEFTIKKLVRAFVAALFCLEDYVEAYIDYLHTNLRSGVEYKANSYVSPCKQLLHLFACQPFSFHLGDGWFSLFDDAEDLRVPLKEMLSGYALILLKLFIGLDETPWFKKENERFSATKMFSDYANKHVVRPSWVNRFLRLVIVSPITRTTNNQQHKAVFDIALQMFNNIDDSDLLVDKNWFDQGRQLLVSINQLDVQKEETLIALEYFLRFIATI